MQYYDDNYIAGKRAGVIATSAYIAMLAVLFVVIRVKMEVRGDIGGGEGVLIAWGDTDSAGGDISTFDMLPADWIPPGETAPQQAAAEDIATQDMEDAPSVPARVSEPERRPTETQQQTAPPAEQQRQPDQRALFPGNTRQSVSGSQGVGTGEGEGRQGAPDGAPGGDPDGTGGGSSGTGTGHQGSGFSLAGRSIIGSLAQPRYGPDKSGRVVVDITVDAKGNVVRAVPKGQGSTTNDSELINAAVEAALKARFNAVGGDGLQTGTITYNFILK